ncbi:TIR domain-containing protein [Bacillus wiedmannii]|uniref:TIR domain-containing protein n=1 Tax=Bacillus wiedmannii TaxID=1890302 RepID=UPI00399C7A59
MNKSVSDGEIDIDLSANYLKILIQTRYITDTSVLSALIGSNTHFRKHIDWEIPAALNKKVWGCSGLTGIPVPEFLLTKKVKCFYEYI